VNRRAERRICDRQVFVLCSLEAGLKAYADSVKKQSQRLKADAQVDPRSAQEQGIAADVSRRAADCARPRPVDGT